MTSDATEPTEIERKATAFDQVRRLWWEFIDVEEGRGALGVLGEFIGEWEHHADQREARARRDSEAAVVNRDQREVGAQAQPAGAAAAPTGQAGGAQSGSAGPPAGLSPLAAAVWRARGGPPPPHLGAGATAGYVSPAYRGVDPAAPGADCTSLEALYPDGPLQTAPGNSRLILGGLSPSCALKLVAAGRELMRVMNGVTPADLRAQGFPDVAAALERGPR